jgi:hypothetical protein
MAKMAELPHKADLSVLHAACLAACLSISKGSPLLHNVARPSSDVPYRQFCMALPELSCKLLPEQVPWTRDWAQI